MRAASGRYTPVIQGWRPLQLTLPTETWRPKHSEAVDAPSVRAVVSHTLPAIIGFRVDSKFASEAHYIRQRMKLLFQHMEDKDLEAAFFTLPSSCLPSYLLL